MKRIEKKRIRVREADTIVAEATLTAEQVLVDDEPMLKVTFGFRTPPGSGPEYNITGIGTLEDNGICYTSQFGKTITPNKDSATWQDCFDGWSEIDFEHHDIEIKDLPVEV